MNDINKAIATFKAGGIVIFPTDTVFGIGCRIDDEKAIIRLFAIKNRSEDQAAPVLVDSLEMAKKYAEISEDIENRLIKRFWPGAITLILPRVDPDLIPDSIGVIGVGVSVSKLVIGNGNTIGLRMPNHKIHLEIIKD